MSAHTENLQYDREDVEFEFPDDLPKPLDDELERLEELFTVNTASLKKITERFGQELQAGLERKSDIPMNITWVTGFPTGKETGTYLTIDLGGTNLRICLITLTSELGGSDIKQEKYELPSAIKTGEADDLFGHIADRLDDFVGKYAQGDEVRWCGGKIPLGFTFSYPATQHRIDHGILQTWTKGWDVKWVEGNDVVEMLNKAIEKRDLPVKLIALVNNTTGALIASAYTDPETIVGAIFGTGCNAAYMEQVSQIPKMHNQDTSNTTTSSNPPGSTQGNEANEDRMAINCEYGAFDNSHTTLPRTQYDKITDEQSPRPGEQTFEKMSAGLYLGEIFRQILLDLYARHLIFQDDDSPIKLNDEQKKELEVPYSMDTGFLSTLENDPSPTSRDSASKTLFHRHLADLALTDHELKFFQAVAKLIAIRGARLCACGASAICQRIGVRKGHVAADGSVATKHPRFKERWENAVKEILDMKMGTKGEEGEGVVLTSAEDGSGVGAAVICALTLGERSNGES